jgi:uncharacterized protein (TIGR00255 family)
MIQSMTAFARSENKGDWGQLVCEMRSINHRYLELSLNIAECLRHLEMPLREHLKKKLQRGKIECLIRFQPSLTANHSLFKVNEAVLNQVAAASKLIAGYVPDAQMLNVADLLRFPGILENREVDIEALQTPVFSLLEQTLAELLAARKREGAELSQLFLQRIQLISAELNKITTRVPQLLIEQRDKLNKRFQEAKVELDANRLEQEMVFFAQRMDVTEEIDRTKTHIKEFCRILQAGGLVGRRLDFLLQELNREANTLGSKSQDPLLSHAAVEIKVLIEQIREQVQNVE